MASCPDVVEGVRQHSAFVDDEGRTNDTHHCLPLHRLLAMGSIRVVHSGILVAH